jgi:hypothetical protein
LEHDPRHCSDLLGDAYYNCGPHLVTRHAVQRVQPPPSV